MAGHPPTPQQQEARDLFATGGSLVIEAGAGTGKTSTLVLLAEDARPRKGQYVAFNKAIVNDAAAVMPGNVNCATAHSLAFRAVGRDYAGRLESSRRVRSGQLAKLLDIEPLVVTVPDTGRRFLAPGFLAGVALRSVTAFCQSADLTIGAQHVPHIRNIDAPTLDPATGAMVPGTVNNAMVAAELVPVLERAWADLADPDGRLPYRHDHYLKAWHLSGPRIAADFVLFDEAQDANPVMVAIVAAQGHAQLVWVGDSQQQIYTFTGAINALATVPHDHAVYLTRSFRFGHAIADVANRILADLPTVLQLEGTPEIDSTVAPVAEPRAVLTRTNAEAVRAVMSAHRAGVAVHLVGDGLEVISFARAAQDLQADPPRTVDHPDLSCFTTWEEVVLYVDDPSEQGDELRLLVNLVEEFGVTDILAALERAVPEDLAERIVSTAHKSKGREWPSVQLAGDFPDDPDDEDLRLLYVACTRARRELDVTALPLLDDAPPRPDLDELELWPAGWTDPEPSRADPHDATEAT